MAGPKPFVVSLTSAYEMEVSKGIGARMWADFMDGRVSSHSAMASTLPYLQRRAEREKVPYVIKAVPGEAYSIERLKINVIKEKT
jgi:hypothetical protein